MGIRLKPLCGACPEDYDVFSDSEHIGYLRLRHGSFAAWTPNTETKIWSTSKCRGDGIFEPDERHEFLSMGILAIRLYTSGGDVSLMDQITHCSFEYEMDELE